MGLTTVQRDCAACDYYLTNIIIITEQMINLRSCAELLCQHRHRIQSQHKRIRERTRDGCDLTAFQRT